MTVNAALYGPFPSRRRRSSAPGRPLWSGSFTAAGDGEYRTEPVTLTVPGYYTYVESIAETELVRPVVTACGDAVETTVVTGTPTLATQVSAQEAQPGATITDSVLVGGLGVLTATVQVELWGPYATREAMTCTGTPYATGTFTANGDGTYTTAPVVLDAAGYYTYRESIVATAAYPAVTTACGEATETTLVSATPSVTTVVSDEVVRPGSRISDTHPRARARQDARPASGSSCSARSRRATRSAATASRTGAATITAPGRRHLAVAERPSCARPASTPTASACSGPRTSRARRPSARSSRRPRSARPPSPPAAATSCARSRRRTRAAARRPACASATSSIDAPVTPVGIDLKNGALGVPASIGRLGWWRDGAAPGDRNGAVLVAGHVDSANAGIGAFFRLPQARRGDRVQVTTARRTHPHLPRHVGAHDAEGAAADQHLLARRAPRAWCS